MKSHRRHLITVLVLQLVTIGSSGLIDSWAIESFCRNASAWTMMADRRHCDRFYVCTGSREDNNSYQEFHCAKDYHFSSQEKYCVRGACDRLANADWCSTSGGYIRAQRLQGDCTRFQRCSSRGELTVIKCGNGLYFDNERQTCLPVDVTPAHQCSCILPEHSTQANPVDCSSYYRCTRGRAVLEHCPRGYYYENSVNSCLLDVHGQCTIDPPTIPIGQTMQECEREGHRVVPHTQDCSRYFVCISSQAIELRCPKGQYFDIVSRYCAPDVYAQCLQTIPTTAPVKAQQKEKSMDTLNDSSNGSKPALQLNSNKYKLDVVSINNKLSSKFLLS